MIMVVIAANVNLKDTVNFVPLALRTRMMDQGINSSVSVVMLSEPSFIILQMVCLDIFKCLSCKGRS